MFLNLFEDEKRYFYFQVSPSEKKIKKEKARERLLLFPTERGLGTELLYRDTPPIPFINLKPTPQPFLWAIH